MKEKEDSKSGQGNQVGKTKNESKSGKSSTQKSAPKKKTDKGKSSK